MTQKELIEKLQSLSAIEPNAEFTRVLRSRILAPGSTPAAQNIRQSAFSRSLSFALSVAFTAAVLLVLTLGSNTGVLKTVFLPSLNGVTNESLATEADSITRDIDVKLEEIQYFEEARRSVALVDEAPRDPSEISEGEDEIDDLLDEIIQY